MQYKVKKYKVKKKKTPKFKNNKSTLKLFFKKLAKILNHKLYFMFIPHTKSKTKTLSLPIYVIVIITLIIAGGLLTTLSFLTKNTVLAGKTEILSGNYQEKLEEINKLERLVSDVVTNDSYQENLNKIMKNLKVSTTDITNEYNNNLLVLNKRAEEFERLKNYLDELKENIRTKHNSLESIPSILPIYSKYAVIAMPFQKNSIISKGIGFETIAGTLIRATATGKVNSIVFDKNNSISITINHSFGVSTQYKGLATASVVKNKDVKKGEIIGVAKTGIFEYDLKIASEYVDPLIFTTLNNE